MNYCSTGSVSDVRNFQSKLVGLLNTTTSVLSHYNHHHHYNTLITFFRIIFIRMVNDSYSFANHSALQNGNFHIFSSGNGWHPLTPLLREKFPRIPNLPFEDQSKHLKGRPYFSGSVFWVIRRNFYNTKYYKKGYFCLQSWLSRFSRFSLSLSSWDTIWCKKMIGARRKL